MRLFKVVVVLTLLALFAILASSQGLSRPVNGQGVSVVGRLDLADYKAVIISCDNLQEVFPNVAGDNAFTIPGNPDGVSSAVQIVKRSNKEWATIGSQSPTVDGLATGHLACSGNPSAWNIVFSGQRGSGLLVIFWASNPGFKVEVHRRDSQIWLTQAGAAPAPSPQPQPQPVTGGIGSADINRGGQMAVWRLTVTSPGTFQISGAGCDSLQVFLSASPGAEEHAHPGAGCVHNYDQFIVRIADMWSNNATGCVRIVAGMNWLLDLSQCGGAAVITPPPALGGDPPCDLTAFQDSRGLINDSGIIEATRRWVHGLMDDACIIRAVTLWTTGQSLTAARMARMAGILSAFGFKIEVLVYDLNGRVIGDLAPSGRILTAEGRPLANGVYLYIVSGMSRGHPVIKVGKLAVLR